MQELADNLALVELEKWAGEYNIAHKISVHRNRNDFWWTNTDRINNNVATGYTFMGANDPFPMSLKQFIGNPTVDVKNICVSFKMTMSSKNADQIINSKLELTANPIGAVHKPWNIFAQSQSVPVVYGVYKPEGFNEAYLANKKLKPSLTELSFMTSDEMKKLPQPLSYEKSKRTDWNIDVVDIRVFDGTDNLVAKFTEYENVELGTSAVMLSLIGPDIAKNLNFIKTVMLTYK
jgi:hypothetical protein